MTVRRARLDVELVRRGLATSRERAQGLVDTGRVRVGGTMATKSATQVDPATSIVVSAAREDPGYVSRGGHKLAGALDSFEPAGLIVEGRRALDVGASTGGFTDVLLRRGATEVVALDVGYGQLAWSLRTDPRVQVLERTNARHLTLDLLSDRPVDLVVGDVSFISLLTLLEPLVGVCGASSDLVVMVKPQFEVGRGRVGAGGVVREPELRIEAVHRVAQRAFDLGYGTAGVVASPLPGPAGNVEYFLWMRAAAAAPREDMMARAVEEGPQ